MPRYCCPDRAMSWLRPPVARPGVGEPLKPQLLENGPAGGEGVDDQVARAEAEGIAGAGGDHGAVEAAAAERGEGAAAVEAGEVAVGVGVEAADAHGLVRGIGDVADVLGAPGTQGDEQ